ncbi:hypothetical protein HYH03_012556 [Edaphochlamys debaryana]|uniref:Carotenoid cleavage dioxygenase n=1 Tax=Edaphochlamys debaryana TaxID=47281 RepID=A0A836BU13_9CHLO|nr:hypothetical protein HYH03_012556 [Edaphochlamys debaryana]|eukprot:KAG2488935.1 hypothetical protein HYH03_012556 [Edaphochlamys debaryana]
MWGVGLEGAASAPVQPRAPPSTAAEAAAPAEAAAHAEAADGFSAATPAASGRGGQALAPAEPALSPEAPADGAAAGAPADPAEQRRGEVGVRAGDVEAAEAAEGKEEGEEAEGEGEAVPGSYVTREARRALFASPAEEVRSEAAAPVVSGSLPSWLRGRLVLNGCGDYRGMSHLFDGFACLTSVRLGGGGAAATQRFLESDAYSHFRRTGRLKYREFATAPAPRLPGPLGWALSTAANVVAALTGLQGYSDNASVTLTPLPGGQLLALSETRNAAYIVDAATLETIRHVTYNPRADSIPGDISSAHVKGPLPDGRLLNFTRSLPYGGYHVFLQDPVTLRREKIAFVKDRDPAAPCWIHDMAATDRHLVIVEPPLYFAMRALLLNTRAPYVFADWRPETGTRVHVVALDGSGVVTHTAPTHFTFHFANAFQRPSGSGSGSEICVDYSVYDDATIINDLSLDAMITYPGKDISPSRLRRLTIPLTDASGRPVGPSALAAPAPLIRDEAAYGNFIEFPAVSPAVRGLPYRYAYGTAAVRPTNMGNALARHDLQEGTSKIWFEPGAMPSEPCFVPRPGATREDDGVVLAPIARGDGGSQLLVLDGGSWEELARVQLPFAVPYRFHGAWVPQEE